MKFYRAGYYLIEINKVKFGSIRGREIITASQCINTSLLESWSFNWSNESSNNSNEHALPPDRVYKLHKWVNTKYEEKRIGWPNIFYNLEDLAEYKSKYFGRNSNLISIELLFSNTEAKDILEFLSTNGEANEIGLQYSLKQEDLENEDGKFLGYDILGLEQDGSFHTLHCHELQTQFEEKFGLTFNKFGLIQDCNDWTKVTDYCNDPKNGLEMVPWFFGKLKIH